MTSTIPFELAALPPTQKLYHLDRGLPACEAQVLAVQDDWVVLDKTVLFAEAGGQVSDRGVIAGYAVHDVQHVGGTPFFINKPGIDVPVVKGKTVIAHQLSPGHSVEVGQVVQVARDEEYRKQVTASHSAAHFAYVGIRRVFADDGLMVKGCFIDHEGFRFDFSPKPDGLKVVDAEQIANELIAVGDEITIDIEPDAPEAIFYWRYRDIVIPCGGTHVQAASQLTPIQLRFKSKGSGIGRFYGLMTA